MNKSMFPGKYGLALSAARAVLLLLAVLLLVATAQSAGGRAGMNDEGLSANPHPQSALSRARRGVDSLPADGVPAGWSQPRVEAAFRSSPIMFIENVGQFDERARFQVCGGTGTMWLTEDALWVTVLERSDKETREQGDKEQFSPSPHSPTSPSPQRGVNLRLSFPGANPHSRIEPFDRLETKVSYFIGNNPRQWRPDVPVWAGVRYVDLYPGVDLELTGEGGRLTSRLVTHPDANKEMVYLRVEGADALALDGRRLRLTAAVGNFTLPLPSSDLALRVEGVTPDDQPITFHVPRAPSHEAAGHRAVVPAVTQDNPNDLLYATFLGGSDDMDFGLAIAVDGSGAAYVTGETWSSDFPTTPGAFDTTYNGLSDTFVAKLNPVGKSLAYATFLGGTGVDVGWGIAVDRSGMAYVTGQTWSFNFPITLDAFDTTHNGGTDAFVVKLNRAGSVLAYATFLGGSSDDHGEGIAVDGSGAAYVTGSTVSSDFPTTPGTFDTMFNGGYREVDAFVAKLAVGGWVCIGPTSRSGQLDYQRATNVPAGRWYDRSHHHGATAQL